MRMGKPLGTKRHMPRLKNRKYKIGYAILIGFMAIFACFFITYNKSIRKPIKMKSSSTLVEVEKGQGFSNVLKKMDESGIIRNKFMVKVYLAINDKEINLNPGAYEVNNDISLDELIETFEGKNNKALVKLTIPEGYTIEDIAEIIEKNHIASKDDFIDSVQKYSDIPEFIPKKENLRYVLEGYLYPDTYYVSKDTECNEIIKMMLDRFKQVLDEIKSDNNITIDDGEIGEIITKASIIEKEARVDNDRRLISSTIDNRINKDMKLQIDATVIYAINEKVDVVLYRHLKKDSPYNTYMYKGLPVGPICSPGKECIAAALFPDDTDYLYYLLKKDNSSHYFTNNYDDFLSKKKEFGY